MLAQSYEEIWTNIRKESYTSLSLALYTNGGIYLDNTLSLN